MTDHSPKRTRVLIVDDSAMMREVLRIGLSTDPMIEVVGVAPSAAQASAMIPNLRPDVMTLDIEMPGMDGVTFLRQLIPVNPLPTVVISSATQSGASTTLRALEAGAVDVIAKPGGLGLGQGLAVVMEDICRRVRAAAAAQVMAEKRAVPARLVANAAPVAPGADDRLLVVGASTGGVQALGQLLAMLPPDAPGMLIVQHMPAGFTGPFAARLDAAVAMRVREACDGDRVERGLVLIAPGGTRHMTVEGRAGDLRIALKEGEPVCYSRPSVDVLFHSAAKAVGPKIAAALLTGMGVDGADGLLAIRRAGGMTIAQDEATSVVWGMPAAAVELGAAERVLPIDAIGPALLGALKHGNRTAAIEGIAR